MLTMEVLKSLSTIVLFTPQYSITTKPADKQMEIKKKKNFESEIMWNYHLTREIIISILMFKGAVICDLI